MTNGTQSIDRAAEILSLVVKSDDPISYTEVVESTELARSTVSRLLSALERNGLVERDGEGLYRGGSLFATYASRFDRVETLVTAADPTLQRLSEETGETVNLAVPSSTGVVQVA
ncbi:helix-turn-helix domain-containing protein, partial [Brevibacterium sp.]